MGPLVQLPPVAQAKRACLTGGVGSGVLSSTGQVSHGALTHITERPENPGPFRLSFGFNRELACATYLILTLPNFIIIGAGRSGTTSLYNYLGQHPDVFMSPVKKTGFFAWRGEPPDYTKGMVDLARAYSIRNLDEYTALFADAGAAKAIGEATPRYLFVRNTAARILAVLPDARLVVVLRNPIKRAFASYLGFW